MNHNLRELAKLLTGVVLADATAIVWMAGIHMLPLSFMGATITNATVLPVVLFDAMLALILVHYGWGIALPVRTVRERTMLYAIGILFAAVALLHWVRIAFGLPLYLGTLLIPVWLSWIAVIITTYLSYISFHFALLRRK
ncbi:MAG TPA: hypothetical protein ENI56_00715 [Candidatus Kaiserbacteria bacterium]|nr:hypothetical protein [Candidatus Kaiserbacteria bacterium]